MLEPPAADAGAGHVPGSCQPGSCNPAFYHPYSYYPGSWRPGSLPEDLNGLADLTFAARDGRTRITHSRVSPPLVAQRVLYPDEGLPDLAFVYLANATAGVFQGDNLEVRVEVGSGAKAHLSTPSATKIFSMPSRGARQRTRLCLREGAYLEYLPEPLIPFRDARFSQETDIEVAQGATLIFWEIISPGRAARGEVLAYRCLRNRLTVVRPAGFPIYHEASRLTPQTRSPLSLGVLGDGVAPALGSMLIVTEAVPTEALLESLRDALDVWQGDGGDAVVGVSSLPDGGAGLKVVAPEAAAVKSALTAAWAVARRQLLKAALPAARRY